MEIVVLRLGHRLPRDERISTHVALVARTFGASSIVYSGQKDNGLEESVKRITDRWGSSKNFSISYEPNWRKAIKKLKDEGYALAHLTMYGMPLPEKLPLMKEKKKLAIIVGSEAVPGEVYQEADFNVAVTNQPHSEVAALAITLNEIAAGKPLTREYDSTYNGKIRIKPNERGKSFY
jgi:tRNA (cytidine56-2'-O)-methyltransferase